jgi:hypothetical protein
MTPKPTGQKSAEMIKVVSDVLGASAIASVTASHSEIAGAATVAAAKVLASSLIRKALEWSDARAERRWLAYATEYVGGQDVEDPTYAEAVLHATSDDPRVQELVLESARVIAEALADSVVPAMARLTRCYANKRRSADRFFRGMRRTLTDLSEDEFRDLRDLMNLATGPSFDPSTPRWEIRIVLPQAVSVDASGPMLDCTGVTIVEGQVKLTTAIPLGVAPVHTPRLLQLLKVNGLADSGIERWGASNPPAAIFDAEAIRRIREVVCRRTNEAPRDLAGSAARDTRWNRDRQQS